jgi:hypothetical protein
LWPGFRCRCLQLLWMLLLLLLLEEDVVWELVTGLAT